MNTIRVNPLNIFVNNTIRVKPLNIKDTDYLSLDVPIKIYIWNKLPTKIHSRTDPISSVNKFVMISTTTLP